MSTDNSPKGTESMQDFVKNIFQPKHVQRWKQTSIATLASGVLLGGYIAQIPMLASATPVVQSQQGWETALNVAKLSSENQLVLQLDVLNKPTTSYANAVYMVYARRNDRWVQIFTNTGARLINDAAGRVTLAPEVISIQDLQRQLGKDVDIENLDLKVATLVRYDIQGGQRDQLVQFEREQRYTEITQTNTTQLVGVQTNTTQTSTTSSNTVATGSDSMTSIRREQSRFSLAIVQKQATLSNVIARVSLKPKHSDRFLSEQFIGDFRYKLKEKKSKAKFIKGLKSGDRVVVRLFTPNNQLIGYSEFELQSYNTAVTLVLPDRRADYGIVRTVYGVDRNEDYSIDRNASVYDYFTQVTQVDNYRNSQITFLNTAQALNLSSFDISGLPTPQSNCSYPASFVTGSFSLVNQVVQVFSSGLASALTAVPGQTIQTINISTTNISIYEVSQLIINSQQVGTTQGSVIRHGDDDDDERGDRRDRGKKPGKRHCNQGIGNGSEGCDPGNSHPHGGSNDGD